MSASLVLYIIGLCLTFYLIKIFITYLNKKNYLLDKNFHKPQAFHTEATPLAGGILIILVFSFSNFYFYNDILQLKLLFFGLTYFLIGFLDDIGLIRSPKKRLIILIIISLILIESFNFLIFNTGYDLLDRFFQKPLISLIFTTFCILFIINGSNFVDGFNGLLGIHMFSISLILFLINYFNQSEALSFYILILSTSIFLFLLFNFPRGKVFLGDGGSYLLGALISIFSIETSKANPNISPIFFAVILYYLFYEVFFSYVRKFIYEKKSAFYPDKKHLHMILYRRLNYGLNETKKSNYLTALITNIFYLITVFPVFFVYYSSFYCMLYFFCCLLFYSCFYLILNKYES